MKQRLLMPLNLQYFAVDAGSSGDGGQDITPAANQNDQNSTHENKPGGEEGKTFTRDEVAKMIAAEKHKAQKAWEKEQQEKQAEAEKLAKMNAQEKVEHEKKQLEEKIAELERGQALAEMNKEASKMLSEASLPNDDELLALIVSDDADATKKAVEVVKQFAAKIKKAHVRQSSPSEGGQFSSTTKSNATVADIAAETRIIK